MFTVSGLVINQIVRFAQADEFENAVVYRVCLVLFMLIQVPYFLLEKRYPLNAGIGYLISLISYISLNDIAHIQSIAAVLASLVWIFAFICGHFLVRYRVYDEHIKFNCILWFIILFFVLNDVVSNYTRIIQARSDVISANNVIYFGFPLLLAYNGKRISPFELIITATMVGVAAFSFKRTTLIVAVVSVTLYYIGRLSLNGTPFKKIILIPIFIVLIALCVIVVDNYTGGHISYRFSVIGSTGGNGRAEVWSKVISEMDRSNISTIFFGNGFNSVYNLFGISAHNDFLECYFDFGVIGLFFYLGIIFYIGKCLIHAKEMKIKEYPSFLGMFSSFIILSLFSHVFLYAFVSIPLFLFLGYLCKRSCIANEQIEVYG